MEQFATIKRRATDLVENAQQTLPSMQMPKLQWRRSSQQDSVKGSWERIDVPSLPRSSHSVNVISGTAYVFGGEINPREPVDNDMHAIRIPLSGAAADYYTIKAAPAPAQNSESISEQRDSATGTLRSPDDGGAGLDEVSLETSAPQSESTVKGKGKERATGQTAPLEDVPGPRVGHATAVIGSRIFLFGGRGGPDMEPLQEAGRVWVFSTRTNTWSSLDPVPAVKGGAIVPYPAPRSYHCATAVDKPREFATDVPSKKPQNWRDWMLGDISKTGIPQDPVVGKVAESAVDEESDGYGTFFVHAGCLAGGDRTSDLWAFDVHSRMWTELPAAPGPARGGTAICVSKSRLFRFGGFDGTTEVGGQLDFLHLEVETFDDRSAKGEVSIRTRGSWQSILQGNVDASSEEIPLDTSPQEWPSPRSVACLQAITLGGGREYLVLTMGEHSPSSEGHAGAGKFFTDVWVFHAPPQGMSAASVSAAMMQAVGRKTGEGKWTRVNAIPYDDDVDDSLPAPRGWLASAPLTDLEETGLLIWGGLGEDNKRLGDGWILRLE